MQMPLLLRPFVARNYRLYFGGQLVSLVGTWMSQTASLWLVYRLTSSALLLGLVGFTSQIPIFLLAPVAGVVVDRVNRPRLLLLTQTLSMAQSAALAYLTWTGSITYGWVLGLTLFQGMINAFDMPTRQTLVLEFVASKEHLGSAIALNSSMFNLARVVGPAIAGFTIAAVGITAAYFIDALSYLAVIGSILAMRFNPRPPSIRQHPLADLREGFGYAFGFPPIRALIVLVGVTSFLGFSYTVLMPIVARHFFGGEAQTLGVLMSASGVGAMTGGIYLASRRSIRGLGAVITLGGVLMGAGLIGVAFSIWFAVTLGALAATGLGGVLLMASSNTLIQAMVEDQKRGRVMSLFTMAFTGTMPLGNLAAGALTAGWGPKPTLVASGLVCLACAYVFHLKIPSLRRAALPVLERLNVLETTG